LKNSEILAIETFCTSPSRAVLQCQTIIFPIRACLVLLDGSLLYRLRVCAKRQRLGSLRERVYNKVCICPPEVRKTDFAILERISKEESKFLSQMIMICYLVVYLSL
jgi:hypothetical protein